MRPRKTAHRLTRLGDAGFGFSFDDALAAFPARKGAFLLDGGDHTLLGAEPVLAFRAFRASHGAASGARSARVEIEERGATVSAAVDDPLTVLRALLREHAVERAAYAGTPLPLLAGAVGYVGYETGQMLERLPCLPRPSLGLPDIALFFHDWVLGRSRVTGETWLSVVGRGLDDAEAAADAEQTEERVRSVVRLLAPSVPATNASRAAPRLTPLEPLTQARAHEHVSREEYLAKVRAAKAHIEAGDAFEICLTHPLEAPFDGEPFALFRELRRNSPAPFAAFLDLPEAAILSSSPEKLVSLDADRRVESRPIKGTRPRGSSTADDERLARELATSPKDRAENVMIVDLTRNDLGRVCRTGSVEVPALCEVERYATVHQLVSTVRGELAEENDAVDLLRACFPPGSMTGAPKIEAMARLEALESRERGPYGGALGFFDFSGTVDLSVVIRTVVVKDGRAHLQVGGAVVADSEPEAEHAETLVKARGMLEALARLSDSRELGARGVRRRELDRSEDEPRA